MPGEEPQRLRAVSHARLLSLDRGDRIGGSDALTKSSPNCATTRRSERQGRLIDGDEEAAMERKKREGYF